MIQQLCFFNIRESLTAYARIFSNRLWIQKSKVKSDAFKILTDEYNFNNVNVIRALACNENEVYFGARESVVPNIFFTTRNQDYSISCMLIMKYFINKRNGEDYGINAQELKTVRDELSKIFVEDYVDQFMICIKYLYDNKVLRKSIYDSEDIDNFNLLEDRSKLYISPRGNELFDMLSRDSILFEMLRESSWRNYENRNYSILPSYELAKSKDYVTIYEDLLDYIDFLCEKEDDVFSVGILPDKYQDFYFTFGNQPMVSILLEGVEKSINYFDDQDTHKYISNKLDDIEKKVMEFQRYSSNEL